MSHISIPGSFLKQRLISLFISGLMLTAISCTPREQEIAKVDGFTQGRKELMGYAFAALILTQPGTRNEINPMDSFHMEPVVKETVQLQPYDGVPSLIVESTDSKNELRIVQDGNVVGNAKVDSGTSQFQVQAGKDRLVFQLPKNYYEREAQKLFWTPKLLQESLKTNSSHDLVELKVSQNDESVATLNWRVEGKKVVGEIATLKSKLFPEKEQTSQFEIPTASLIFKPEGSYPAGHRFLNFHLLKKVVGTAIEIKTDQVEQSSSSTQRQEDVIGSVVFFGMIGGLSWMLVNKRLNDLKVRD